MEKIVDSLSPTILQARRPRSASALDTWQPGATENVLYQQVTKNGMAATPGASLTQPAKSGYYAFPKDKSTGQWTDSTSKY
ncbi:MAG: hypothetical protein OXU34_04670 [Gammaproteobacteria bacterium]|nr:hypothetical protein [Gammaproteobacteria bacterium]